MTQRAPVYTRLAPRAHPVELLTWARGVQLGIQPTPFIPRQSEWPNPVIARPNHELRGWVNGLPPGVVGNPVPPIWNRDWPNPTLRVQNHELRTWLHAQQITPPIVLPFGQTDWPNPRAYPRNQDGLSWTNGLPSGQVALTVPRRQSEWPNPLIARPPDLKTWTQGLPPGAIALTIPPLNYDWPNPVVARANADLRTFLGSLQIQPQVQVPFNQFNWPNPAPRTPNLDLRTWVEGLPQTALALTVPPVQLDWPNPVLPRPAYAIQIDTRQDLLTSTLLSLVTVPDVVGETQAQATIDILAAGLTVSVVTDFSDTVPAGIVISEVPPAGSLVASGSAVTITVSLGARNVSTGAGRRRRRLFVQIDGQDFEVESAEHAMALLDQAKALALKAAGQRAEAKITVHLVRSPTQRPKVEKPKITSSNPELQVVVKQARASITQIYADAYRDAEIRLRLEQLIADEDDDDDVLMLL